MKAPRFGALRLLLAQHPRGEYEMDQFSKKSMTPVFR